MMSPRLSVELELVPPFSFSVGDCGFHKTGNVVLPGLTGATGNDQGGRLHRPCAGEAAEEGRGALGRPSLAIIADAQGQR